MRVGFISLGCSKNLIDTEMCIGLFKKENFKIVTNTEEAEIIVINTCGFIESAKEEAINTILEMASFKDSGNCRYLIVMGCLVQRYKEELIEALPEVDLFLSIDEYDNLWDKVSKLIESKNNGYKLEYLDRVISTGNTTAYLKIAEGCSNHCTYCVIPQIRGKYRSRDKESILNEAKALVNKGVKELVLIAQDTSCYGKDLYGKPCLSELIRELSEIDGLKWIRVHYLYPEGVTDELIEEFASNEKLVKYFDIPLQHFSGPVLKKMARRTNPDQIKSLVEKIRGNVEGAVIRTSLIVGFPGETEEDFYMLYDFLKEYKLDRVGVFTYSQEESTPAADYDNQIEEEVKQDRKSKLEELLMELTEIKNQEKIDKTVEVLVEGKDKVLKMYYGRTYADSIDVDPKVFFKSEDEIEEGSFVKVKLTDYIDCDMIGELVWKE